MDKKSLNKGKKPYQKPEIKIIDLVADEVLAVGCKTSSLVTDAGTGTSGPSCQLAGCSVNGS